MGRVKRIEPGARARTIFRALALAAAGALALAAAPACERFKNDAPRPDIIFIVVDSLRADGLGCYGNKHDTTPFLDALAAKGARFDRAYCNSTHTKVSMSAAFSGLPPPLNGVRADAGNEGTLDKLPRGVWTMAESFSKAGYYAMGFSTNPYIRDENGFGQGFDELFYLGGTDPKRSDAAVVNKTVRRFFRPPKDKPYFLYIHYMDVHYPYQPTRPYRLHYTKGLEEHEPYYPMGMHEGPMSGEKVAYTKAFYHGAIREWDDRFRALMKWMRAEGLLGDAITVVASDHGEEFYEHGGFGHNFHLYEETLRVPLIVAWENKIPGGIVRKDVAQLLDLYPTLAAMAGVDFNVPNSPGRDLFENGPRGEGAKDSIVYAETFRIKVPRCIVRGQNKLIYNEAEDDYEYYRLGEDPAEKNDLYPSEGEAPESIGELRSTLRRTMESGPLFSEQGEGGVNEAKEALKSLGYLD